MKYKVDTKAKTIVILSSYKYEDFIVVFQKYEGYTFKMEEISVNYVYN